MADDCDRAQEINELHLDNALAEHVRRGIRDVGRMAVGECVICGEEIPEARRIAVPFAIRCIDCQTEHEMDLANRRAL